MYARNVAITLKHRTTAAEFTRTLEQDVLPMLRKQDGFKDEITFVAADGREVLAISLWDRQDNAESYGRNIYPAVLKSLGKVVDGSPMVTSYEVSSSTFHKIPAGK